MEMGNDKWAALPSALAANTKSIIFKKSAPITITTQQGIDRNREKGVRITSVEQVELGNIMEQGMCSDGQDNQTFLVGGVAERSRWVEQEEPQPVDSCKATA